MEEDDAVDALLADFEVLLSRVVKCWFERLPRVVVAGVPKEVVGRVLLAKGETRGKGRLETGRDLRGTGVEVGR